MTIAIDDVVRVVLTWTAPLATIAQNVWHMVNTGGGGGALSDLLDDIETQYTVAFADLDLQVSEEYEATLLEMFRWDFTLHQWDGVGNRALSLLVGTDAGDYLPHGNAYVLRYLTEASRRQGRMFVPGIPDTKVVDGVLVSSTEADLALFMADWGTDISVGASLMELCTFNSEPTSPLYETASVATGDYVVNSIPGYQRRRKPGVGI